MPLPSVTLRRFGCPQQPCVQGARKALCKAQNAPLTRASGPYSGLKRRRLLCDESWPYESQHLHAKTMAVCTRSALHKRPAVDLRCLAPTARATRSPLCSGNRGTSTASHSGTDSAGLRHGSSRLRSRRDRMKFAKARGGIQPCARSAEKASGVGLTR